MLDQQLIDDISVPMFFAIFALDKFEASQLCFPVATFQKALGFRDGMGWAWERQGRNGLRTFWEPRVFPKHS